MGGVPKGFRPCYSPHLMPQFPIKLKSRRFDLYDIEFAVVRARNRLNTLLSDKGDRDARKIFVIGHARTGTTSFHRAFNENGLNSEHSPGNWHLAGYDAFSDRGDYRPVDLYRGYYPNAHFILNTRPVGDWVISYMRHRDRLHSRKHIVNMILRRNQYFARIISMFKSDDRLTVVDISRPGAINFGLRSAGLPEVLEETRANSGPKDQKVRSIANYEAVAASPVGRFFDRPFLIPELLAKNDMPYQGWETCVRHNLDQ